MLLAATAALIRINNAILYPIHFGFDAPANWEYIERLMRSWALPAPGEGWSTSHPPFFYYLGALVGRIFEAAGKDGITIANRLLSSAIGLLGIAAAVRLVRGEAPDDPRRAFIAALLLLFLPVHVYMSAMLGEEIIAAALVSIVVVGAAEELRGGHSRGRVVGLGLLAGLALLTKLSGLLTIAAVSAAFAWSGLRSGEWRRAIKRVGVFASIAVAVGAWPYLVNRIQYGYFYPQNLEVHELMFTMPPGDRSWTDYARIPWATFTEPQVLAPDLLHSVWGTTYTTIFFDGHRVILPREDPAVSRAGSALLLLGLLPTVAFFWGLGGGLRRAREPADGPDALLGLLVAASFAGYVLFTWRNPWYATLKGSYLLGIAVPFAFYASEVLSRWTRSIHRPIALATGSLLGLLVLGSALTFTVDLVFEKREGPGFVWPRVDPTPYLRRAFPERHREDPAP